ncbi:MAG: filamentous hemagglutinin N-terminal domain-containing protein [Chlorobium sp.]|nr:filamentous hemagglutinin N-terminal domain-containing protein [Chlorobium sp.]
MQRHGSLNRAFRMIWNASLEMWQVVAESAKGGHRAGSPKRSPRLIAASTLLFLVTANGVMAQGLTGTLPTGNAITAGSGSVSQSNGQMVINQTTDKMAVQWQSFSIGPDNSVTFNQPSSSAIALNRVLGSEVSQIQGALNANGRVFLLNPNGILFSPTAQVNVGGLVASTLALSDDDFLADRFSFSGDSPGSVVNQGAIKVADGGCVALIAATIENSGSITAPEGSVLMGAGRRVTLDLGGPVKIEVEEAAVNALIKQGGLIKADGGLVYLTARAADELMSSVINQTGIIEAQTLASGKTGEIYLMGDMNNSRIEVGGTIDASAPHGGDGGFIETSAARVTFGDDFKVSTKAAEGADGAWLIDPYDFTVAASGGDITGATLSSALDSNNVTIQTLTSSVNCVGAACGSGESGNGDIFVNDSVSWSSNLLTLSAWRNIEVNSALNGSGSAELALEYGQGTAAAGNNSTYNVNAPINLASTGSFSTKLGSNGTPNTYTIITALGAVGSTTGTDLQGMEGNLSGRYVLGADINAGATASWNGGAGFMPVGYNGSNAPPYSYTFAGTFDGLGHTITNLTINRPATSNVGLFAITYYATIRNVGLVAGSFTGDYHVGALVGQDMWYTTINNSYATGNVIGNSSSVGGLVGSTEYYCDINNSYATGNVNGLTGYVGGLVGQNDYSTIRNSYATGSVTSISDEVGGLVGENDNGSTISNSYATGNVNGGSYVGGLAGDNYSSTISNAYATGSVSGSVSGNGQVGGLVGLNEQSSTVSDSFATGIVTGASYVGGLVGYNDEHSTITKSNATGSVTGGTSVGGLVGYNEGSTISNSYATGSVTGSWGIGGLVGNNYYSPISNSYATGRVIGTDYVGGLVGYNNAGTITSSYWDTITTYQATSAGSVAATYGKTTLQMMEQATFNGWDFTAIWWMNEANTRPFLRSEYSTSISNAHQLQLMALNLDADYTLAADIDMMELTQASGLWKIATGFLPVGHNNGAYTGTFTGTFDGQGHTITGLFINRPSTNEVGLFGFAYGATISNVGLVGGSVSGQDSVGGLVGYNKDYGNVTHSYATGSVSGTNYVGGLVGYNEDFGNVTHSYATGSVSGTTYVGGLVGVSEDDGVISYSYATGNVFGGNNTGGLVGSNDGNGTISDAYATGSVSGGFSVGGLVGSNHSSTVRNSYATGSVTGSSNIGGLVGYNNNATVTNSYWDTETTHQATSAGGTGKTTAEMMQTMTFTGWDFDDTWWLSAGDTRPFLRSEYSTSISNAHQLQLMALDLDADYTLAADINMAELTQASGLWNTATRFLPVGNGGDTFTGTFDGQGHTITGLFIDRSATDFVALFGYADHATISNVGLVGGSVSGHDMVGGLVGLNYYGTISDAYTSSSVSGRDMVGGLVGSNSNSPINNVYATGNVSGTSVVSDSSIGGLVGRNSTSTVSNAYATGTVTGMGGTGGDGYTWVGGLVGSNGASSTISTSYATGSVTSSNNSFVGGLVGYNTATISSSFATGNVLGYYVGGLVGGNASPGSISDTYATGSATGNDSGSSATGGLVGYNNNGSTISGSYATGLVSVGASQGGLAGDSTGTVTDSYWDTQTTNQAASTGSAATYGKTTSQMKTLTTFAGWDVSAQGAQPTLWRIYEGATAPLLRSFFSAAPTLTPTTVTKVYDGTAVLSGGSFSLSGGYDSNLVHNTDSYRAASKDVGTHTIPNQGIYSYQTDYDLVFAEGSTIEITPAGLTVTGLTAANKVYDGADTATLNGTAAVSALNGDTVTLVGTGSGVFANKNVGTNKVVTVSGYSLGGVDAGNYTIAQPTGLTANITPADLAVTGLNAANKVYDGTALATLNGTATVSALDGDTVALVGTGSGVFANKNVGTNKVVTVSGYSLGGANAGNYAIVQPAGLTANITVRPVNVAADPKTKDEGQSDPLLTFQAEAQGVNRGLVTSESLVGALTRDSGESAGAYAILQGTVNTTSNPNYDIQYTAANLAITAAGAPAPEPAPVIVSDEPLQAAIETVQNLAPAFDSAFPGGSQAHPRGGRDLSGSPGPDLVRGQENERGGMTFVEVSDNNLDAMTRAGQGVPGPIRVFMVNGGINLPELARD